MKHSVAVKHMIALGATPEQILSYLIEDEEKNAPKTSTERVRKHRERNKNIGNDETGNGETLRVSEDMPKRELTVVTSNSSTRAHEQKKNILLGTLNPKRGTRLPENFILSPSLTAWAKTELGLTEGFIRSETDRFRDYWVGVPGAKGLKLDWDATWRNWMRNARSRNGLDKPKKKVYAPLYGQFG